MGAVFKENLHARAIVAIQVRSTSFATPMQGCGVRATISIRPIDYIERPATSDLLVCATHADALKARAREKGLNVSVPSGR